MLFFIAIFLILYTALALKRLDWAILVLIACLPAYLIRFKLGGLPLTLLEAMILISFAVWFFKNWLPNLKNLLKNRFQSDKGWTPYPFSWEIIAVIIIAFVAAGVAEFNAGALGIWKAYFFEPILLFILIMNVFSDQKGRVERVEREKIYWALLISAAVVAIFAIFQKITGLFIDNPLWAAAATRRVVSFFGYPNAVGLYLAPLILLFTGWLFSLNWKSDGKNFTAQIGKKLIIVGVIIISLLAVYFARSEGALAGITAGLIIFGLFAGRRERWVVIILAILIVAGVFYFAPAKNFVTEKITLHDLSGEIRRLQWKETMTMLSGPRFWLGAGLDNYQTAIAPYHQVGFFFNRDHLANFDAALHASAAMRAKYWQPVEIYLYPHNIFLNFWSELGLAGALLFTWIILKYLFIALKLTVRLNRQKTAEKYLTLGLATAMVAIIIHGLVDVPYFKNDLAAMFWLLVALLGAARHYAVPRA